MVLLSWTWLDLDNEDQTNKFGGIGSCQIGLQSMETRPSISLQARPWDLIRKEKFV